MPMFDIAGEILGEYDNELGEILGGGWGISSLTKIASTALTVSASIPGSPTAPIKQALTTAAVLKKAGASVSPSNALKAANLLSSAKKGNPTAKKKVTTIAKKARIGNPTAKKELTILRTTAVVNAAIANPPSDSRKTLRERGLAIKVRRYA
jgi:hypothetical protein